MMCRGARLLPLFLCAACSTLSEAERLRLRVFDAYVEALAVQYPFFGQKRIDWQGLAAAYRSSVVSAERGEQFYHLLAALFSELDDPHVAFRVPAKNWELDGDPSNSLLDVPGFRVRYVDRRLVVVGWPAGGEPVVPEQLPAGRDDLPELVRVDGARATPQLLGTLLRGAPSTEVELQLRWSDGTRTRHTLQRPTGRRLVAQVGGEPTLERYVRVERADGHAIVRIDTLDPDDCKVTSSAMGDHIVGAIAAAKDDGGLVIDLRSNGGGNLGVLGRVVGGFLRQRVEMVMAAQRESWLFGLVRSDVFRSLVFEPEAPFIAGPLVVWTSGETGSAAELLTRLLQRECGATVIGEQTIGAEAMLVEVAGEDGTCLIFGRDRLLDRSGVGFQDEGITPDIAVRLTVDDIRRCGGFEPARADWDRRLRAATARAFDGAGAPPARDG